MKRLQTLLQRRDRSAAAVECSSGMAPRPGIARGAWRLAAPGMAILALAAGCAGPPTRYYTLAAPVEPVAAASAPQRPVDSAPLAIELAPISMPERLARPQMVVRQPGDGPGARVEVLEQHRWASSFDSELRDALSGGIAARLGAMDATRGARPPGLAVWRIAVQLRRFDAVEGSRVDAAFGWSVRRAGDDRVAACQWQASEPVAPGLDALAQGAQRVVARAADAMARHVAALRADAAAGCPV